MMSHRNPTRLAVCLLCAGGGLAFASGPPGKAGGTDLEKMQGRWAITAAESNGKRDPEENLKGLTVTFEGNRYTVRKGDKVLQSGTQKLDPTKTPRQVDITAAGDGGKSATRLGIYELKGDTLRVCFAAPGKERPREFKTTPDSGRYLNVAKRLKKE
jgi:uncharacterized protein (TIGR03067 family)